ncbi:MAG: hypothetical protein HC788_12095 [Sphingopyxis sp.]|nr:hypothetical protein [Sphingopyxis sp.]
MSQLLRLPALHASHAGIWLADSNGAIRQVDRGAAIAAAASTPHILINAPLTGERLGYGEISGLDLLELFAFVHPAYFAVPTANGLAQIMGQPAVADEADVTAQLQRLAGTAADGVRDAAGPEAVRRGRVPYRRSSKFEGGDRDGGGGSAGL